MTSYKQGTFTEAAGSLYITSAGLLVCNWLCYDKCFDFTMCYELIVHGVVGFINSTADSLCCFFIEEFDIKWC